MNDQMEVTDNDTVFDSASGIIVNVNEGWNITISPFWRDEWVGKKYVPLYRGQEVKVFVHFGEEFLRK